MYRLTDKDIEVELSVALLTALRENKAGFRSSNRTVRDAAEQQIVQKVLAVVSSKSTCVMRADRVGWSMSEHHGTFGIDEPWPAPPLMEQHMTAVPCITLGSVDK